MKAYFLVLLLIMMFSIIGCGQNSNNENTSNNTQAIAQETTSKENGACGLTTVIWEGDDRSGERQIGFTSQIWDKRNEKFILKGRMVHYREERERGGSAFIDMEYVERIREGSYYDGQTLQIYFRWLHFDGPPYVFEGETSSDCKTIEGSLYRWNGKDWLLSDVWKFTGKNTN